MPFVLIYCMSLKQEAVIGRQQLGAAGSNSFIVAGFHLVDVSFSVCLFTEHDHSSLGGIRSQFTSIVNNPLLCLVVK